MLEKYTGGGGHISNSTLVLSLEFGVELELDNNTGSIPGLGYLSLNKTDFFQRKKYS